MTIAVRLLTSTPSVTSSAVEADPNPLGPGLPVINEKIPMEKAERERKIEGEEYFLLSENRENDD